MQFWTSWEMMMQRANFRWLLSMVAVAFLMSLDQAAWELFTLVAIMSLDQAAWELFAFVAIMSLDQATKCIQQWEDSTCQIRIAGANGRHNWLLLLLLLLLVAFAIGCDTIGCVHHGGRSAHMALPEQGTDISYTY